MDKYIDKLVCEDAMSAMAKMPSESVDLLLTDPPYRTTPYGNNGTSGGMFKDKLTKNGKIFKHNDIDISVWLPEAYRVLNSGSHCYIMTNHINLKHFLDVAESVGLHFIKCLIWDKVSKIMGRAYMSQYEYILFMRKGAFKQVRDCGMSDILTCPITKEKDKNGDNIHDTEKPIDLMKILIQQSTEQGDIVFDPFAGSFPVACAAAVLKRRFVTTEIEQEKVDSALKRYEEYIKQPLLFV